MYYFGYPLGALPTLTGTGKLAEVPVTLIVSACWRKYVADWKVEAGHLYLFKVSGKYAPLVPLPTLADWVSGTIDLSPKDRVSAGD